MIKIYTIALSILLCAFLFLTWQNKALKTKVEKQVEVIEGQKASIDLWQTKQKQAIEAIRIKENENKRIEKERKKYEQEFNQKASKEYHQWRINPLPFDITHRLQ